MCTSDIKDLAKSVFGVDVADIKGEHLRVCINVFKLWASDVLLDEEYLVLLSFYGLLPERGITDGTSSIVLDAVLKLGDMFTQNQAMALAVSNVIYEKDAYKIPLGNLCEVHRLRAENMQIRRVIEKECKPTGNSVCPFKK